MKKINKILQFTVVSLFLSACSTAPFKVVSEPDNANVFLIVPETNERKPLGLTPITKTKDEINELLDKQLTDGGMINLVFEKDGYSNKEVWIPSAAGGDLGIDVSVTLTEGKSAKEEMKVANDIIGKLFLAQSYARTQQFERALIELDKVLEAFPEFDRALTMKGAVLYGQGSFKTSLEAYEKALEINPELRSALDMSAKIRKRLNMAARDVASKKVTQ